MEQLPPPKQWRFARKRRRDSSSGEVLEGEAAEEKKDKKEEGEAEPVVWGFSFSDTFGTFCKSAGSAWDGQRGKKLRQQPESQHLSPSQQASVLRQFWVKTMVIWSRCVILIKPFDDHYSHDCIIWQWSRLVMIWEIRLSGELYEEGLAVTTWVLGVKAPI